MMNESGDTSASDLEAYESEEPERGIQFIPDFVQGVSLRSLVGSVDSIVAFLLAVMVAIALIGVFGRVVPAVSIPYLDQMLPDMLVWISLLGGASALATREHLGISFFAEHMRPRVQKVLRVVVALVLLGFFVSIVYGGLRSVAFQFQLGINSPAGYPLWIVQLALPVSGVLSLVFIVLRSMGRRARPKIVTSNGSSTGGAPE